MNPRVFTTVVGVLATMWHHIAAVIMETITRHLEVVTNIRELTDQRLLPMRCRLFRRSRVLVAHVHVKCLPKR
ncbi:MAG: hypothetical protein ACLPN1_09250 [Dissulfurispiraceae bacterium]